MTIIAIFLLQEASPSEWQSQTGLPNKQAIATTLKTRS